MKNRQVRNLGNNNQDQGLSQAEGLKRLKIYGLNTSSCISQFSFLRSFIQQFLEPLIVLLAACSILIFFVGDRFDSFIILGIIFLNTFLGAFQERRIASMVQKLKSLGKRSSTVIRSGITQVIPDQELVPGDIVILQEGDHLPADARLLEGYDVTVDESVITGESDPVQKSSITSGVDELSEKKSLLFYGSHIVSGYVKALIVATGDKIEAHQYQKEAEPFSNAMPLQKDLSHVLRFILWLIVFICSSLFVIGMLAGKPFPELLAALLALFMCVVPQGLPVIMTVILVTGAYAMARRKIIAKRLQALEALGRAHVVIIDKTGTLTKNELMVTAITAGSVEYTVTGTGYNNQGKIVCSGKAVDVTHGDPLLTQALEAVLLLDRSVVECRATAKKCIVRGSTNDAALKFCAQKYGLTLKELEARYKKLYEIPFSAVHQYHAGFYEYQGEGILFILGSPEAVQKRFFAQNPAQKKQIDLLVKDGSRVLVLASKKFTLSSVMSESERDFYANLLDNNLEQIAVFGIQDTLREHASEVIQRMHNANIKVVMATGDNPKTASFMAHKAGILRGDQRIMEGPTLHQLSDEELVAHLDQTTVYARVLPADKVRLTQIFQKQGNIVMVIGDGVNDVPALSVAHVSVAMGATGTELAKEAAHIVILDDAFEKIPEGIEYGRHIFYTFKRVILYFFTTNFAEVLVMLFALAGGFPVPLLACQILWLNLVTDGFLDTALSLEPLEKDLMDFGWMQEQKKLLDRSLVIQVVTIAFLAAGCSFGIFYWYLSAGLVKARTMAMVTLTCCQWVTAMNCRSLKLPLWRCSFFSNRWLALALLGIFLTQIAIIYVPVLQLIFKTVPLLFIDWALIALVALALWSMEEFRKYLKRSSAKAY